MKGDATHWLTDLEYEVLQYRLETAQAAEAALVEARRRVRETFIWGDALIKRS